jgi:hypothetical protein
VDSIAELNPELLLLLPPLLPLLPPAEEEVSEKVLLESVREVPRPAAMAPL